MATGDPHRFKTFAIISYALYLVPGGLLTLLGLLLAYTRVNKGGEGPNSHFVFQIRSFWIGVFFAAIGALTLLIDGSFAPTIWLLTQLWFFVRSLIGLLRAVNNQGIPSPRSYFLGL